MSNYFSKPDSLVDAVSGIYAKDAGGEILEEIERNAAYKMVKVKQPDGRVVMRKMRKEIDVERHAESVEADVELEELDEKKKLDPVDPKELKGKHSEREDGDIDNDGDEDESDEYLHKRRKAVKKAMKKDDNDDEVKEESVDLDKDNVDKALKHDCATHVKHEEYGQGTCIKGMHTLEQISEDEAVVTHYDVMFQDEKGPFIVEQVAVEELEILVSESHTHKKMKREEVEIDEARGRPRKDGSQGNEPEPDEHFHMQIRKVTDYNKPAAVKHKNGQTTMLHPDHAKKINNALTAMKPNDREKVVNHMHAHPNNLKQVIQHVSK